MKNPSNREKKIILISTQVVEAGVDIDMDLGFKDSSIIDSDEQLAGRINRNVNKQHCTLYLFNYNRESVIYGKDLRYKSEKIIDIFISLTVNDIKIGENTLPTFCSSVFIDQSVQVIVN